MEPLQLYADASKGKVHVHNANDRVSEEMRHWHPPLQSFDADFLPDQEDSVARTKDVIRNDATLSSGVRTNIDKVVGANFRMSYNPDGTDLGIDLTAFTDDVERTFRNDAEDDECWFDAGGRLNFTEMVGCAMFCHYNMGEIFAVDKYLKRNGNRPFSTAVSILDPARLQTPSDTPETHLVKSGFLLNNNGYARGAWILNRHPGDYPYTSVMRDKYLYIPRKTPWGRSQWFHVFHNESPGQTRGRSQFIAGLRNCRMLDQFHKAALSNAIIQSLYAAVIQSPDPTTAFQGLMSGDPAQMSKRVTDARNSYYAGANEMVLNRAHVAHTYPGDELKFLHGGQNMEFYDPFESSFMRKLARILDISYEELTGDYTKTNYSGARAGRNDSDIARQALGARIAQRTGRHIARLWLEEMCALGRIKGVPGRSSRLRTNWFWNNQAALTRFSFHGPGIPHIDPVKGTEAAMNEIKMGTLSRKEYCNVHRNRDFREVADEIAAENKYAEANGIDINSFLKSGTNGGSSPDNKQSIQPAAAGNA